MSEVLPPAHGNSLRLLHFDALSFPSQLEKTHKPFSNVINNALTLSLFLSLLSLLNHFNNWRFQTSTSSLWAEEMERVFRKILGLLNQLFSKPSVLIYIVFWANPEGFLLFIFIFLALPKPKQKKQLLAQLCVSFNMGYIEGKTCPSTLLHCLNNKINLKKEITLQSQEKEILCYGLGCYCAEL